MEKGPATSRPRVIFCLTRNVRETTKWQQRYGNLNKPKPRENYEQLSSASTVKHFSEERWRRAQMHNPHYRNTFIHEKAQNDMPTHTLITKEKKKREAVGVADACFVFALPNASSTANGISLEQDEWVVKQSRVLNRNVLTRKGKKMMRGRARKDPLPQNATSP